MNRKVGFLILVGVLIAILAFFGVAASRGTEIAYSAFNTNLNAGMYQNVLIEGSELQASTKDGKLHKVTIPDQDQLSVSQQVSAKNVKVSIRKEEDNYNDLVMIILLVAVAGLIAIGWSVSRAIQSSGGPGGANVKGALKSPARLQKNITTRLADVAGIDEVVNEVEEIIDYLKNPARYTQLGGKVPRGVLMSGSPGTGKTLLARAVAGEANVPFYSVSGSEFVEMYVGVGSGRIRAMFEEAKKNAPCLLFIDEIDSIARARGGTNSGGSDERESTLNQLLVEMDGFETGHTVIVIAATNRPDILDSALLRRFTRSVHVGLPDIKGREAILGVHTRGCPLDKDVDLAVIAKSTPGLSGADLGNLVNESALIAAREHAARITMRHFDMARDKLIMGLERKTIISEEDKRETAYHEAGHAVVGHIVGGDPIHKITIVPRGQALGLTVTLPEEDRYSLSQDDIKNRIAMLFGGRVAEALFNKSISTGASDDFARASEIARRYVAEWGMSKLGPMVMANNRYDPHALHAQETLREVDVEVKEMLQLEMQRATAILQDNANKMHAIVNTLMQKETIDREEFLAIMNNNEI